MATKTARAREHRPRNDRNRELAEARRNLRRAQRDYKIALRRAMQAGVALSENEERDAGITRLDVQVDDTKVHIYVGGLDNPRHGHWVVETTAGELVYRRDPGEPHGWWNHRPPVGANTGAD